MGPPILGLSGEDTPPKPHCGVTQSSLSYLDFVNIANGMVEFHRAALLEI